MLNVVTGVHIRCCLEDTTLSLIGWKVLYGNTLVSPAFDCKII